MKTFSNKYLALIFCVSMLNITVAQEKNKATTTLLNTQTELDAPVGNDEGSGDKKLRDDCEASINGGEGCEHCVVVKSEAELEACKKSAPYLNCKAQIDKCVEDKKKAQKK